MRANADLRVILADAIERPRRCAGKCNDGMIADAAVEDIAERTTGFPGPAKATAMRRHSHVLSRAIVAGSRVPPGRSAQANASAAPASGLFSDLTAATLRLSIQAAKARPSESSATVSNR